MITRLSPDFFRACTIHYFGGGPDIPKKESTPPPTVRIVPEVEKAKSDLREQLKRRRGRAASRLTGTGVWDTKAQTARPVLMERLGS